MSDRLWNVAIVGATGAVGEVMCELLGERQFPIKEVFLLASERSAGETRMVAGRSVKVENLAAFDFSKADIALFSAGGSVSREYAPKAAAAGCVVIDNTSEFRYEDDIPLVIPEVNPQAIAEYQQRNIIANPNCSTMQMLVAIKPIYDAVGVSQIHVSTYQAVSGSGKQAMNELMRQTTDLLNGREVVSEVYPWQIAFNVLPQIDAFQENGFTREEMKMVWETQKIFNDDKIEVHPTAVRVPVFHGHSESIYLETSEAINRDKAMQLLRSAPGVKVLDEPEKSQYALPVSHASGSDHVWVSRIRQALGRRHGLNMWVVSDNLRKGAALNTIQIAEELIQNHL